MITKSVPERRSGVAAMSEAIRVMPGCIRVRSAALKQVALSGQRIGRIGVMSHAMPDQSIISRCRMLQEEHMLSESWWSLNGELRLRHLFAVFDQHGTAIARCKEHGMDRVWFRSRPVGRMRLVAQLRDSAFHIVLGRLPQHEAGMHQLPRIGLGTSDDNRRADMGQREELSENSRGRRTQPWLAG